MKNESRAELKRRYDQVGWKKENGGEYQHVPLWRDLRPVSREYVSRCRRRVMNHLKPSGRLMLDVGSGPIPFQEMIEYSQGYQRRICVDISITALEEARKRIGDHGLFVMADIIALPFRSNEFDAAVAMNVPHFLRSEEQNAAIDNLYRVLAPESNAVASFASGISGPLKIIKLSWWRQHLVRPIRWMRSDRGRGTKNEGKRKPMMDVLNFPDPKQLLKKFANRYQTEIFVYRSLNTNAMKLFIHEKLGGRMWLRLVFALEENYPKLLSRIGSKALLVIGKPANS